MEERPADALDDIGAEGVAGVLVVQTAAVVLLDHGGVLVTEQRVFLHAHVLADEIALEQRHVTEHLVLAVGEFPVTDHDIQTQNDTISSEAV